MTKPNKKLLFLLAGAILLAIFIPQNQAQALGIFDLSAKGIAIEFGTLIMEIVTKAIGWMAQLLDEFITYQTKKGVYGITVVDGSWKIIRNFVNMFFIIVLIIMAFGTIFDIQTYSWKNMLAKFIIAALLVNFSLTIGQYIITVANGLSSVFLSEITKSGGLTENLGSGSSIVKIVSSKATLSSALDLADVAGSVAINLVVGIIFLVVTLIAFSAVAIFTIVRLFALWFLLIISPLAWFGYTMPNLRPKLWSKWWSVFLCWCFFLPYFLFFMMFATMFIKNKNTFPPLGPGQVGSLAFNDFMFYGLSLAFMIGGLYYAKKLACASGSYVGKAFGSIEAGVRRYAPGAAYVRGAAAGAKERAAEIAEKGLPVPFTGGFRLGGAASTREQEARAKGWFAPSTTGEREARKQEAVEIDKEVKRLRDLNLSLGELNERIKTTKGKENIAALRLKAENGWLDTSDQKSVIDAVRYLGGARSASGAAFITSLQKGDFERLFGGPADKEAFAKSPDLNTPELIDLKKALLLDMANNRETFDKDLMKETLALYKTDAKDVQDKVKEALKKNMDNLARGKTTAEKEALLTELGGLDKELQRSFALSMAEANDVIKEDLAVKILDMYKDQSAEAKKKIEDALKGNVKSFAKNKAERETLVNDTSKDIRLRAITAQVMVDEKEVGGWAMRRQVLELNGGIDPATGNAITAEGRKLAKDMSDNNAAIKEEAEYRKNNPTTTHHDANLTTGPGGQYEELERQIVDNINAGLIRNLDTEDLKSPTVFNALYNGVTSGRLTADQFNKAVGITTPRRRGASVPAPAPGVGELKGKPDRKKREAINKLVAAVTTGSGPIPYP